MASTEYSSLSTSSKLSDVLEHHPVFLDQLALCLDRDMRPILNWKQLARELNVHRDVIEALAPYEDHSPTIYLFEYLKVKKPQLTIQQLRNAMLEIRRNDLVRLLTKGGFAGSERVQVVITSSFPLLNEIALALDKTSRVLANWRHLAMKLGVSREDCRILESYSAHSPTSKLFQYLEATRPQMTLKELRETLHSMERIDLLDYLIRQDLKDETLLKDVMTPCSKLLQIMANKLDNKSRVVQNWHHLADKLDVPADIRHALGGLEHKGKSPTKEVMQWLVVWFPDTTLKDVVKALDKIQRIDAIQIITRQFPDTVVPAEIVARGPKALESYRKALSEGKTSVKRLPVMLIGQERTGKTSLKKSLKGEAFNKKERRTVGIEVDPSYFKLSTEIWRTSGKNKGTDSESETSFECRAAARLILKSLKKEENSMGVSESQVDEDGYECGPDSIALNNRTFQIPEETNTNNSEPSLQDHRIATSERPVETAHDPEYPYRHLTVREVPDDVALLVEKLLEEDENEEDEEIYSVLWDFGGQSVYYTTHPIFLSPKAIYILVCDLSRNPDDKAEPLVRKGMFKDIKDTSCIKTNRDYLDFWLSSVYSLRNSEDVFETASMSESLPTRLPPVFFVCTHADKPYCSPSNSRNLALEIYGLLRTKTYREHLYKDVFVVDNTKAGSEHECPEVIRLRDEVRAVAKELLQMKEEIPLKWLKYENALQHLSKMDRKWITLTEAKEIASKVCNIDEKFEFETLLNFLHDQRILIHFNGTAELERMVILDPQWLIDVFKQVITVKRYEQMNREVENLWSKLEKTGILDEHLLEHVWSSLFDKRETRESLTAIMEKFSLICSWPSNSKATNKEYLVPSMLLSPPKDAVPELLDDVQNPSLYVKFISGQVPPGLFCRLILQFFQWCNAEWKSKKTPQLFQNFAMFYLRPDKGIAVLFRCHSSSIEVIFRIGNNDYEVATDVCSSSFDVTTSRNIYCKLKLMMESMRKEFDWLKNMAYEMCVCCLVCSRSGTVKNCPTHHVPSCSQEECLHFVSESELYSCQPVYVCNREGLHSDCRIQVKQFSHWFAFLDERETEGISQKLSSTTSPATSAQCDSWRGSDRRLKVTVLSSEWGSSKFGLSTMIREIAILLANNSEVEVTLLVPQFSCKEEDKRAAASRNITILEAEKRLGFQDPLDWLIFPPTNHTIDVIVGHGGELGKQAQFIRVLHKCKWVQVVHTAPEELSMHKGYSKAISKGEAESETEIDLCKLANLAMAVGPKLAAIYSSYLRSSEKDIFQLTPGVFSDLTLVKQASKEGVLFKVLVFSHDDPEDFNLKGYDIAAKAIVELKDQSYSLVFVGAPDGKHEEVAQQFLQCGICRNQLTVRKFVQNRDKLKELLCEVDLAIMPSRTEGFGLTALEALSAGLPILVSSNSGFGEALQAIPYGSSFVVDSEDCKKWAEAITAVRKKDRAQRLEEIQTLRKKYEEKYSWQKLGKDLIDKMWNLGHD